MPRTERRDTSLPDNGPTHAEERPPRLSATRRARDAARDAARDVAQDDMASAAAVLSNSTFVPPPNEGTGNDVRRGASSAGARPEAPEDSRDDALEASFTARLRYLFASTLRPTGARWTLNGVARATEGRLSTQQVYALYTGQSANPTLETLRALAAVFGVTPDFFVRPGALAEAQERSEHAYAALLADPQVAFVSRRMGQLSPADKAFVTEFVRRLSPSSGEPAPTEPQVELRAELRQDLPEPSES